MYHGASTNQKVRNIFITLWSLLGVKGLKDKEYLLANRIFYAFSQTLLFGSTSFWGVTSRGLHMEELGDLAIDAVQKRWPHCDQPLLPQVTLSACTLHQFALLLPMSKPLVEICCWRYICPHLHWAKCKRRVLYIFQDFWFECLY